jgi:CBS domain-containing protein
MMKASDLLTPDRILVPFEAPDLRRAVEAILERLEEGKALREGAAGRIAEAVASGAAGELVAVTEGITLVAVRSDKVDDLTAGMVVSPRGFSLEPREPGGVTEVLLLLLTPRRLSTLKVQALPSLVRVFRDDTRRDRLRSARNPEEVRGIREFMEVELDERLLVEDAMTPLAYRVFPETPMGEVLDLMVRRELTAIPVVGGRYEVLGVITAHEALQHLLPRRVSGEGMDRSGAPGAVLARDVMTRSVMCVSQDQSLLEAANLIVNRDVAQVPVIREGEFVGFLTRDAVLKTLSSV